MTKRQIASALKSLKKRQDAVANERDKLDAVIQELEMLRECCDRAHDSLESARDALSELV